MEIASLIELCRHGEEDALAELYKTYAPKLRSVCRRYLNNEAVVEDALHDAFVVIFTSLDSLRDDSKAETWMVSIARNIALKCNDHNETPLTISLDEISEVEPPPLEEGETNIRGLSLAEVIKLIDKLPEGYRQVFRLSVFEGLTHKEIATMLGIEPHSSSSQLTRAKQMLRKMMQQYRVALLILLVPVTILLLKKEDSSQEHSITSTDCEDIRERDEGQIVPSVVTKDNDISAKRAHTPIHGNSIPMQWADVIDIKVSADSVPQATIDTFRKDSVIPSSQIKEIKSKDYIAETAESLVKEQTIHNWQVSLAYAVTPLPGVNYTNNYLELPSFIASSDGSSTTSLAKLYSWGDYMEYIIENAPMMDSVSAANMNIIASINSSHPLDSLSESKHFSLPLTVQLSLSRQINDKWSLSSGLSYSLLKSTSQSGNESTTIKRTETLHYLGVPVRFNYKFAGGSRWNLYASGGLQVDMPVSGHLNTQYLYRGAYAGIKPASASEPITNAPWILSVGGGVGVQVVIIPHMTMYIEPNLNYYVPLTKGLETYRTERPFDITLPVGIRFSW